MFEVSMTMQDLKSLAFFRVAVSEEDIEQRHLALQNAFQISKSERITEIVDQQQPGWLSDPDKQGLVQWIAETSDERHEASIEFFTHTYRLFVKERERKLNIAEEIGKRVLKTIDDGKFEGVLTEDGILDQVRQYGKSKKIRLARDHDSLREFWNTYRGVVHLGMAMDYCDDHPGADEQLLIVAEKFRRRLSENCPGKRKKPYVDATSQIVFSLKDEHLDNLTQTKTKG